MIFMKQIHEVEMIVHPTYNFYFEITQNLAMIERILNFVRKNEEENRLIIYVPNGCDHFVGSRSDVYDTFIKETEQIERTLAKEQRFVFTDYSQTGFINGATFLSGFNSGDGAFYDFMRTHQLKIDLENLILRGHGISRDGCVPDALNIFKEMLSLQDYVDTIVSKETTLN